MRFYCPIAKFDAERRMVWGYASTEAEDEQGETVRREALAAALDDYMRFANIREMHQPSAVGIAEEAAVDDKGLYVAARIVDAEAWAKVMAGVYKGFSIGGRITARDPADRNIITGLELSEISVVDRPANPEAVFDCWKRAASALGPAEYADPSDIDAAGPLAAQDKAQDPSTPCPDLFRAPTPSNSPAAARKDVDGRDKPGHGEMASGWSALLRALVVELCDILETLGAGSGDYATMSGRRLARPDALANREPPLAEALAKFAGEIVPRLDALHERVEQIARTPLPPQAVARGLASVAKRDDAGLPAPAGDDIVAALARMSEEERTLVLIKAARATPIRPIIR